MPAARNGALWWIVLLLALFCVGAWEVMIAPLITGEVYPAYSSLRTDPLGAKALFESLSEQPGLEVARLYRARSPLTSKRSSVTTRSGNAVMNPCAAAAIASRPFAGGASLI